MKSPTGIKYYESGLFLVRDMERRDITEISKRMRKSDIDEVWATRHYSPIDAMLCCWAKSTTMLTIERSGFAVLSFGIVPDNLAGRSASIWMLSTDGIFGIPRSFVRYSRKFINLMLDFYPYLYNFCDIHNGVSLKWLKWCGARLGGIVPYGIDGRLFQHFCFIRN